VPVNDPSYVTLSARNALGMCADIIGGSRWSISGYDVKPFPPDTNPRAQQFVRTMIRQGVLEEASRAEYKEVQDANEAVMNEHLSNVDLMEKLAKGGVQEGRIQEVVAERRAAVKAKRLDRTGDTEEHDPADFTEVHHQEGSAEPTHESLAQNQTRGERPETVEGEGEDGEEQPVTHQAARKRSRSRS
jgi:hypothetical protein